jgi:hypothetical protein
MEIKETSIFTRRIQKILDDESHRLLQLHLLHRPEAGDVIPGSGGIRKIRWAPTGSGKRGGARIMYYWAVDANTFSCCSRSRRTNKPISLRTSSVNWRQS